MNADINALGELISWKPPSEVPLSTVRTSLVTAGLDEKLARDMAPRNAFSRAAQKMKDGRVIEQVDEDKQTLTFQFTKKFLAGIQGYKEMEYCKECYVILDKNSGLVTCKDPVIEQMAQDQLVKAMDARKANDITRMVQEVFEKHDGELIAVREQGGVYFVPEHLESVVDKVDTFLGLVGGNLRRFRITPDGGKTDASVAQSIHDHFQGLLGTFKAQVEVVTSDASDTIKARKQEQLMLMRGKLETYRDLLRDFAGDIQKGIGEVEKFYLDRLNTSAETPDPGTDEATPVPVNFDDVMGRLKRSMAASG